MEGSMELLDFLNDQVIATYVVAILALLSSLLGFFIARWSGRNKPKEIIVSKEKEISLVAIDKRIKDEIHINFGPHNVGSIYMTHFSVINRSEEIVKDVKFTLNWNTSNLLRVLTNDNNPERKDKTSILYDNRKFEINIPYINSNKLYKDKIVIEVYSEEKVNVSGILGGGPLWGIKFFDAYEYKKELVKGFIGGLLNLSTASIGRSFFLELISGMVFKSRSKHLIVKGTDYKRG